jgi:hypothetical protein
MDRSSLCCWTEASLESKCLCRCIAPSPFSRLYLDFLAFLNLAFHAGLKATASIVIWVLAFLFFMAVDFWVTACKEMSAAPAKKLGKKEEKQKKPGGQSLSPQLYISQDGLVTITNPKSVLQNLDPPLISPQTPDCTTSVPVKWQGNNLTPIPVRDTLAEHPVSPDMLGDINTDTHDLPAALGTASVSTRSVLSGNLGTTGHGLLTAPHTLPESDSLGNLQTIEPSSGSLELLDPIQLLTNQLDAMNKQGILLRGRYRILGSSEQHSGSQGVVRFAKLALNPAKQFAVKFFVKLQHFEVEQALYVNPLLLDFLPPTDDVSANDLEPHVLGHALPPMIVTERGESLDEWTRRCKPDFYMCISIVGHLAKRVKKIHDAGLVHRDLKPANVMWLPSANGFTVIDFGSAARAGEEAGISCTLAYAAPEAVAAHAKGETCMLVTGGLDVWSLGVIFYEFLTRSRVMACSRDDIFAAALGQAPLPWEEQDTPRKRAHMRRLGFLRELVLSMLDRDPVRRITMTEMQSRLRMLMKRETTTSV